MALDLSTAATNILASLGSKGHAVLVQTTGATFNPISGTYSGGTESRLTPNAAVLSPSKNLIDGTRIQSSDKIVYMDNSVTPKQDDIVEIGGIEYRITELLGENPNGVQQYWELVCRA